MQFAPFSSVAIVFYVSYILLFFFTDHPPLRPILNTNVLSIFAILSGDCLISFFASLASSVFLHFFLCFLFYHWITSRWALTFFCDYLNLRQSCSHWLDAPNATGCTTCLLSGLNSKWNGWSCFFFLNLPSLIFFLPSLFSIWNGNFFFFLKND